MIMPGTIMTITPGIAIKENSVLKFALPLLALLVLSLTPVGAESETVPKPLQFTVAELAALSGAEVPEHLSGLRDVNTDDKYAQGIDVLGGEVVIVAGEFSIAADLLLFVREGKIGCVRLMQTWASHNAIHDDQASFNAVQADLLKATDTPDSKGSYGDSGGSWTSPDGVYVTTSRGYDQQGLFFYILRPEMENSFKEYWAGINAEFDAGGGGGFFWF
jgi:hypothetical protein